MSTEAFSFLRDNLAKAVKLPWYAVLSCIAALVVRDQRLWVVSRRSGVGDGPLALVQQVRAMRPDIRVVWLTRNPLDDRLAEGHRLECVRHASWKALRLCLRAGVGVMTHGFSDLRGPAIWGATVIQLWHGAPLKRIGRDRQEPAGWARGVLRTASTRLEAFWNSHCSAVIAGSPLTAARLRSAMSLADHKVIVTGDPRMDLIGQGAVAPRRVLEALAGRNRLGDRKYFALIAPTWRDGGQPSVTVNEQLRLRIAGRSDLVVFVRSHPHSAEIQAFAGMSNVVALPPDDFPDVTALLAGFDMLLTDYSSIAMDFSVLERPIVLVAPDLEAYTACPGLYEDYGKFSADAYFTSWSDGLAELDALCEGAPQMLRGYVERSRHMAARYHPLGVEGNAARVAACIFEMQERG